MNAKNEKRRSAIDEEAFFRAIFDNLSPDAVATAIVALRAAALENNSAQEPPRAQPSSNKLARDRMTEAFEAA
jgi:hypothetical protein